ncbi:MAG: hypothetical protein KDE04_06420 [Anaerolineales bacterium]|nr:hypothetical protein [Anaerolineales bacterium]MCB0010698.1 hypothetical protein [Anaerolineales bacterium]MCB8960063.1 hypothetical protein [Ardenticatenales bacterium]
MRSKVMEYEYCTVEVVIRDDGRDPGRSGHKMMWLQFVARKEGATGMSSIVARSDELPLANMTGAQAFGPSADNPAHTNTLENLLSRLKQQGWEPEGGASGDWWQRRLRRPLQQKKGSFLDRFRR